MEVQRDARKNLELEFLQLEESKRELGSKSDKMVVILREKDQQIADLGSELQLEITRGKQLEKLQQDLRADMEKLDMLVLVWENAVKEEKAQRETEVKSKNEFLQQLQQDKQEKEQLLASLHNQLLLNDKALHDIQQDRDLLREQINVMERRYNDMATTRKEETMQKHRAETTV